MSTALWSPVNDLHNSKLRAVSGAISGALLLLLWLHSVVPKTGMPEALQWVTDLCDPAFPPESTSTASSLPWYPSRWVLESRRIKTIWELFREQVLHTLGWMKNPVQPDEIRMRAIAAVVEGTINEFGEGGLGRLCFFQICKPFAQHLSDPAYLPEYELWIKIVSDVCARRRIAFDARAICERFTDLIWARELGIDLE